MPRKKGISKTRNRKSITKTLEEAPEQTVFECLKSELWILLPPVLSVEHAKVVENSLIKNFQNFEGYVNLLISSSRWGFDGHEYTSTSLRKVVKDFRHRLAIESTSMEFSFVWMTVKFEESLALDSAKQLVEIAAAHGNLVDFLKEISTNNYTVEAQQFWTYCWLVQACIFPMEPSNPFHWVQLEEATVRPLTGIKNGIEIKFGEYRTIPSLDMDNPETYTRTFCRR